jgi:hypothetical protein
MSKNMAYYFVWSNVHRKSGKKQIRRTQILAHNPGTALWRFHLFVQNQHSLLPNEYAIKEFGMVAGNGVYRGMQQYDTPPRNPLIKENDMVDSGFKDHHVKESRDA